MLTRHLRSSNSFHNKPPLNLGVSHHVSRRLENWRITSCGVAADQSYGLPAAGLRDASSVRLLHYHGLIRSTVQLCAREICYMQLAAAHGTSGFGSLPQRLFSSPWLLHVARVDEHLGFSVVPPYCQEWVYYATRLGPNLRLILSYCGKWNSVLGCETSLGCAHQESAQLRKTQTGPRPSTLDPPRSRVLMRTVL
jgi:hypothetical protein